VETTSKPLFADLINSTPGLTQELKDLDAQMDRQLQLLTVPTQQRLLQALECAKHAFWSSIAEQFPEVGSGDMAPEDEYQFDAAASRVAYEWLKANHQGNQFDNDPRMSVLRTIGGILFHDTDSMLWSWTYQAGFSAHGYGVAMEALDACWKHISDVAIQNGLINSEEWLAMTIEQQCETAKIFK
jgi:hypothetical protein